MGNEELKPIGTLLQGILQNSGKDSLWLLLFTKAALVLRQGFCYAIDIMSADYSVYNPSLC